MYPLACPRYRSYYLNGQTMDEVLLFKTYDSDINANARFERRTSPCLYLFLVIFFPRGWRERGAPLEVGRGKGI